MRHNIPKYLIYSRLISGILIFVLGYFFKQKHADLMVGLLIYGLISDIIDGIVARKLNVSNTGLRRLDSNVDQIFFISVLLSSYLICSDFYMSHRIGVITLLLFEVLIYVVSFLKFKKEVATHAISSKVWTVILVAFICQLLLSCSSGWLFYLTIALGVITRIEILAIILILREWTNDVPSFFHAISLRNGKPIKRNKFFNG